MATYFDLLPDVLEMVPGNTFDTPRKLLRKTPLPCVKGVSPKLAFIDLHCYEHEVVVLLSGENLWFARDLKVSTMKAYPCVQENAGRRIQARSDRKKAGKLLHQDQQSGQLQKVSLGSCLEAGRATEQLPSLVKVSVHS